LNNKEDLWRVVGEWGWCRSKGGLNSWLLDDDEKQNMLPGNHAQTLITYAVSTITEDVTLLQSEQPFLCLGLCTHS